MQQDMHQGVETIEIATGPTPDAAVIWLHGLGADGNDFAPIVPHLQLDAQMAVRFVFPHAPVRPVTINGGMAMRAWYDIDPERGLDSGADDIRASAAIVESLVRTQIDAGIAPNRIVLAGFSQGGVMALHTGLRQPHRLAGIMALSTYLHAPERLREELTLAAADTPILMTHGTADPMIPIQRAVASRAALEALGYPVEWHQYPMGHEVCLEEIGDIGRWLARRLPPQASAAPVP